MSVSEPPHVRWMLTCDAWPNARWPRGPDFTAFDGELIVGRVYQAEHGPEKGLWLWTMSVEQPGPPFPGPVRGVEEQHGQAGPRAKSGCGRWRTAAAGAPQQRWRSP